MRRSEALGHVAVATLLCCLLAVGTLAWAGEPQVLGEGVSDGPVIAISKIMEDPESYVGKTVKIEGPIVFVCKHRGRSIDLGSDKEFQQLKVMMAPGTFPMELMGKPAVAEGTFHARQLTLEQTREFIAHEGEAHGGETVNPEEITEPMRMYYIEGTGVEVR